MSRNGQRSKGFQVTPVLQSNQAEWNDDEQDGFLVNVPTKEE